MHKTCVNAIPDQGYQKWQQQGPVVQHAFKPSPERLDTRVLYPGQTRTRVPCWARIEPRTPWCNLKQELVHLGHFTTPVSLHPCARLPTLEQVDRHAHFWQKARSPPLSGYIIISSSVAFLFREQRAVETFGISCHSSVSFIYLFHSVLKLFSFLCFLYFARILFWQ